MIVQNLAWHEQTLGMTTKWSGLVCFIECYNVYIAYVPQFNQALVYYTHVLRPNNFHFKLLEEKVFDLLANNKA